MHFQPLNTLITIRRIATGQNTIPYLIPPNIESDEEMAEYMERVSDLIKQDQTGRLYLHEQLKWLEEKYREAVELLGTEGSYLDKYEREAVKIGFTYPSFLLATKLYDEAVESYFNKEKSSAEQIT